MDHLSNEDKEYIAKWEDKIAEVIAEKREEFTKEWQKIDEKNQLSM